GGRNVQGERLRKWREKEKMSQEELAEKSNVSRTTIHLIESGQSSTVKIRTLQKLAVVFNKQVKDFF
ncbi:helix-turn-helix transcriptional regulator, partial [Streptococcus pneumoniae]|nr:helix-turn-helix transcriptional regulator [Streptococcus pneumoniae]